MVSKLGFFNHKYPVIACQWFKNGDHPHDGVGEDRLDDMRLLDAHPELLGPNGGLVEPITDEMRRKFSYKGIEGKVVRFFRRPEPEYAGAKRHSCSWTWHEHGWIDNGDTGMLVCPGSWIVTDNHGNFICLDQDEFSKEYEKLPR